MMNMNDIKEIWEKNSDAEREFLLNELQTTGNEWQNLLQEKITIDSNKKVLDIGCGVGFLSLLLAIMGYKVTAIDCSSSMLNEAKKMAKLYKVDEDIDFIQMDVDELNFNKEEFDIIVSRYAFWLFEKPEVVYEQCFDLLKKGGLLLNFDSNWLLPFHDEECKKRFMQNEQELIEKFGEFNDFYHHEEIMKVFNRLPLSSKKRPDWDKQICLDIGFINIEQEIYYKSNLRNDFFALRYKEMPIFSLKAEK